MRNAIILGSGRSGTSMVTGAFAGSGYNQGPALHTARASNPKGFFESAEVNGINEALLASMLPMDSDLREGQRWLGVPRADADAGAAATGQVRSRIVRATARAPFCYKDPRFSFTLPAWRSALPSETGLVCVFRHPALTATSLVREVSEAPYLRGVAFDLDRAFDLWTETYRAIRREHEADKSFPWTFVHYDQFLTPEGVDRVARFLDAPVDARFADRHMRRAEPSVDVPFEALDLYEELCERAGHSARTQVQAAVAPDRPEVTVAAWIAPGQAERIPDLIADVAEQRGVSTELVLLDATDGELEGRELNGVRVEPGTWSRAADLRRAAERSEREFFAIATPGARWLPAHLAHAVDALVSEGAGITTCDYLLADAQGQFVDRTSPVTMGDVPGPFFEAGLVGRRACFTSLDQAAFRPGELMLWRALATAGRATHVIEPGFAVDRDAFVQGWDRAQEDASLATLATSPFEGAPSLSVSLCTYNRRAVLRECLESFARQRVAPGTFELVVTDDGSTDGTADRLTDLSIGVPLTVVRQPNAGLSAARNAGLARMRGHFVLFVNDDTIASPELIERHLARHAARAAEGVDEGCVLGTFEQPTEALDNAMLRHLEGSSEVFAYADLDPSETYDAFKFWTCNVSAPLAAVRRAGGYDESFRHYGCEDTDLGFRMGLDVVYEPSARAMHRHFMDFDYLRRRAQTVARAYVRFFRKHPRLLKEWGQESLSVARCLDDLRVEQGRTKYLEGALSQLSQVNVGALFELEGQYAEAAQLVMDRIAELLPDVNRVWWRQGYVDGMRELGLSGFDELYGDGAEPWPIASATGRVLFAWPKWDEAESLRALLARVESVATDGFATLLLRLDPERDPAQGEAMAALQAAWRDVYGEGGDLEVLLEESDLERGDLLRLARSVDGFLPLGSEPGAFLAKLGTERLETAADVRAWRARYEGEVEPESHKPGSCDAPAIAADRLALSVVVPTHERPRELFQLLDALRTQDIGHDRFEVIVVDDGSTTNIESMIGRRDFPFALTVLTQAPAGPGAARNRGVEAAQAELVVFFNDDALPAPDALRRHLAAHATTDKPQAVLGTFRLLPKHLIDSFALAVEQSTVLFAQPHMKPGVRYHGRALCTGNVSMRRADILAAGGFDEALPYAGGEDSELGMRLERDRGVRVVFDPRVVSGHDHELDVRGFATRRRVVGWGAYRMHERHPEAVLLDIPDWDAFAARVEAERSDVESLEGQLAELCSLEREGAIQVGVTPGALQGIERLSELAYRQGILMGKRGELPMPRPGDAATPDEPDLDAAPEAPAAPLMDVEELPAALPAEPVKAKDAPPALVTAVARVDEPHAEAAAHAPARPTGSNETSPDPEDTMISRSPDSPETTETARPPARGVSDDAPERGGVEVTRGYPSLPIAGPGAAATTGVCRGEPRGGLGPARGLRDRPESLELD